MTSVLFGVKQSDRKPTMSVTLDPVHKGHRVRRAKTTLDNDIISSYSDEQHTVPSLGRAWPHVIVRDPMGRTLDTFTTLQDAIYRASWTMKTMHEWPTTSLQWRLPKAPVPSKPDFSRAGSRSVTTYSLDLGKSYRKEIQYTPEVPVLEIDVDDVSFVAESLQHLPQLPSFAFLRHSLLAGQRTYLRIVTSILLHQRQMSVPDKRQPVFEFPGFCYGCRRAGLCYGCDKSSRPHVHEDIPLRTGGGFVYWRPDRPQNQQSYRHPNSWPTSDEYLKNIIQKCGGLESYERSALAAHKALMSGTMDSGVLSSFPRFERVRFMAGPWPGHSNIFSPVLPFARQGIDKGVHNDDVIYAEQNDNRQLIRTIRQSSDKASSMSSKDNYSNGSPPASFEEVKRRSGLRPIPQDHAAVPTGAGSFISVDDDDINDQEEGNVPDEDTDIMDKVVTKDEVGDWLLRDGESGTGTEYDSGIEVSSGRIQTGRRIGSDRTRATTLTTPSRSLTLTTPSRSLTLTYSGTRSKSKSPNVISDASRSAQSRQITAQSGESLNSNNQSSIPFAQMRSDVIYKAPAAFKLAKRNRRAVVARDPFSKERNYNIPKGGQFQLKTKEKKVTQFINIKRGDASWTPPKKFELKQLDRKGTSLLKHHSKTKGHRKGRLGNGDTDDEDKATRRRRGVESADSGLDSDFRSESIPDTAIGTEPELQSEIKKRPEIVKKARRVMSPPGVKERPTSPRPQLPLPQPTPVPTPQPITPPTTPPTPPPPVELPEISLSDISLPEIPPLPEWQLPVAKAEQRQKKLKFMVSAPSTIQKEAVKKRRAAPRIRKQLKLPYNRLKTRPGEAPVTSEDVQDMQDPLDWLAKYCIINPDRLPLYELVFESVIVDQIPRYTKEEAKDNKGDGVKEDNKEEEKERKKKEKKKLSMSGDLKHETPTKLTLLDKGILTPKVGMSLPEQQLEKLCYTLDTLQIRLELLSTELEDLEDTRRKLLADKAKELFPQVTSPDYTRKKKKGKKKSKDSQPTFILKPADITDDVIIARLDNKMMATIQDIPEVRQVELELGRAREKAVDIQERVEHLASEKLLTDMFCMNNYFLRQNMNQKSQEFRRQQSELYNRLNPEPDVEMNLEEMEDALQQINRNLLTEKEFFFLYNVLNLPARTAVNFRLFSIVAALSEKVTQLDPVVRKLINNFDYNALDIKMEKCHELFQFLKDDDYTSHGGASTSCLAVELTAGGLTPEHTNFVLQKFNREGRGLVDFLDFVTYVPLFILIHKRIVKDPLREDLDL